jgi:hypothetical protein
VLQIRCYRDFLNRFVGKLFGKNTAKLFTKLFARKFRGSGYTIETHDFQALRFAATEAFDGESQPGAGLIRNSEHPARYIAVFRP